MLQFLRQMKRRFTGGSAPRIPVLARHAELSVISSADDDCAKPSDRLLDIALQAANRARCVSMDAVTRRMTRQPYYPEVWPGEHYKLLAGIIAVCKPQIVVEIGTFTGLSALAMREALPADSRLVTFDIIPWNKFPDTCLSAADFASPRLEQIIADVSVPEVMRRHADLFQSADVIFADGPKDGQFEQTLLDRMEELRLPKSPLVILDDIRVWNMLAIWRGIRRPKLDVTSLGHWSGTGLIDWS
jgi:predicted O-methyltransferase YrrM